MPLPLSNRAFWDTDIDTLDVWQNQDFIIRKVFDRGSWQEMKWCVKQYGQEAVVHSLCNAPYLRDEVVRLCCVLFELEKEQFKCYTRKQQMPMPLEF